MHTPKAPTQALLAALWKKNLREVLARIDLLDRAAHTPSLHPEAQAIAHKLAGSLGMYGYPAATAAARAYEQELDQPTPNPTTLQALATQIRITIT